MYIERGEGCNITTNVMNVIDVYYRYRGWLSMSVAGNGPASTADTLKVVPAELVFLHQ